MFTLCQAMRGMASEQAGADNVVRLFASTVQGALTHFDGVSFAGRGHRNYAEFLQKGAYDLPAEGDLLYESDRALVREVQERIVRLYGYAVVKKACSGASGTATLELSDTMLTAAHVELLRGRLPERLQRIRLQNNALRDDGMRFLADALEQRALPSLAELNLDSNLIRADGARALCERIKAGATPALQVLFLSDNQIGTDGLIELAHAAGAGGLRRLRVLRLTGNRIGDPALPALVANCDALPALEELWLQRNEISDNGLRVLEPRLRGSLGALHSFGIGDSVTDGGLHLLLSCVVGGAFGMLTELRLNVNSIGDPGMEALGCGGWKLPYVRYLSFSHNRIGDAGTAALAAALGAGALPALQRLWLDSNSIADRGFAALSKRGGGGSLTELVLNDNRVGDDGILAFAAGVAAGALPKLAKLALIGNRIGDKGITVRRCSPLLPTHPLPCSWLLPMLPFSGAGDFGGQRPVSGLADRVAHPKQPYWVGRGP